MRKCIDFVSMLALELVFFNELLDELDKAAGQVGKREVCAINRVAHSLRENPPDLCGKPGFSIYRPRDGRGRICFNHRGGTDWPIFTVDQNHEGSIDERSFG